MIIAYVEGKGMGKANYGTMNLKSLISYYDDAYESKIHTEGDEIFLFDDAIMKSSCLFVMI